MVKKIINLAQEFELNSKDNFHYQAGDNSLVITNYDNGIVGVREVADDYHSNEYYQLELGETDSAAILAYINSYVEFVLGDPEEFELIEVLENIKKWSS